MKNIVILFFSFLLFTNCSPSKKINTTVALNPKEFSAKMSSSANVQIIDVRTPEEFSTGHINNAVNINIYNNNFVEQVNALNKTLPTFVYCKAGARSNDAAKQLMKQGFTEVYDLKGGLLNWMNEKLEVEKPLVSNTISEKIDIDKLNISNLQNLTLIDFESLYSVNKKLVIVDFNAVWCGPCRRLTPLLEQLEKEYINDIQVIKVDVDKNEFISNHFAIKAIPLLHFYNNGKLVNKIEGVPSRANLIYAIEKYKTSKK